MSSAWLSKLGSGMYMNVTLRVASSRRADDNDCSSICEECGKLFVTCLNLTGVLPMLSITNACP